MTIMSRDSLLFNIGFNTCDVSQFENLLSNNFEFYHDKDSIQDRALFLPEKSQYGIGVVVSQLRIFLVGKMIS